MLPKLFRFKRFVFVLSFAAFLLPTSKTFATDYPTIKGQVVKVTDGDTVNMAPYTDDGELSDEDPLKLRFLHVDTPELHIKNANGAWVKQGHWGQDAKNALLELLPLYDNIRIEDHGIDFYGRTLATVYHANRNINLAMVKEGWALPYILCSDGECSEEFFEEEKVTTYFKACKDARELGLGIWNPEDPLTEYPFEFRMRVQGRTPDKYMGDYTTGDLYPKGEYDSVDICNAVFFYKLEDAENLGFVLQK